MVEPILARSTAAAETNSGAAMTNDMPVLPSLSPENRAIDGY
jgi:hypothetical protein